MKTFKLLSLSIVIVGLTTTSYAQHCMQQGDGYGMHHGGVYGMHHGSGYGMQRGGGYYDPATEATLTGTISDVKNVPSPSGGAGGLHLILDVPSGSIEVHLGPASFVSSKNVTFAKGDEVTVLGSKVKMADQEILLAREVRKGDQVVTLRDAKGFPLWSGRGRTS